MTRITTPPFQNDLERGTARKRAIRATVQVTKADHELGILWGYASVADIEDLQGDLIPQAELVKAMYGFMESYALGNAELKVNHDKTARAVLVESTFHFYGSLRWFVGVRLLDERLRQMAREGKISGFSIGGTADREEVDEPAD